MNKILLVMLMTGTVITANVGTAHCAVPTIKIVTNDVDLGEVEKGKIYDYKIEVKNAGKEDLVIENVYSGCGCLEVTDERWPKKKESIAAEKGLTAAELIKLDDKAKSEIKKVIIKPGRNTFISARLDTNKVSGQFERMIHIISNDPEKKDAIWKVTGKILDSAPKNVGGPLEQQYSSSEVEKQKNVGAVQCTAPTKIIMVFYSPACGDCREIMENFLPKIKEKYAGKIMVIDYNIENPDAYAFLLDLQNKFDEKIKGGFFNPKPPAVFIENKLLYGVKEVKEKLEKELSL